MEPPARGAAPPLTAPRKRRAAGAARSAAEGGMLKRSGEEGRVVEGEPDRADRAVGFEPHERAAGPLHRLPAAPRLCLGPVGESIDIVDERDVDPIETQALKTVLDR